MIIMQTVRVCVCAVSVVMPRQRQHLSMTTIDQFRSIEENVINQITKSQITQCPRPVQEFSKASLGEHLEKIFPE